METIAAALHQLHSLRAAPTSKFSLAKDANVPLAPGELFLGELVDLGTVLNPRQAKAWHMLANWCYEWGRKSADKAQVSEGAPFFKDIPAHSTSEEKDLIVSLFSRGLWILCWPTSILYIKDLGLNLFYKTLLITTI